MKPRYFWWVLGLGFVVWTALFFLLSECSAHAEAPLGAESGICFSPDERCEFPLAGFLSSAKTTLDIAIYDINEPGIVSAILQAQARGVAVRIACDKTQAAGLHSQIKRMAAAGVPVRYGKQKGIMHDKFSIVDRARLETGSFNYTIHASAANQENQFYTEDPKTLARYRERFEKIWAGGTPVTQP